MAGVPPPAPFSAHQSDTGRGRQRPRPIALGGVRLDCEGGSPDISLLHAWEGSGALAGERIPADFDFGCFPGCSRSSQTRILPQVPTASERSASLPPALSQLGDADPASRPRLSPAAGVGGEGLPRGAGALAVASSPRGSHPSPGRPQWRWGDLARVFLRVTRSRSAALRVPPGKAAADTSRRRACARLSPVSRGVPRGGPGVILCGKGREIPFHSDDGFGHLHLCLGQNPKGTKFVS